MQPVFELDAQSRQDLGTASSRRERKAKQMPAVIYSKSINQAISISHDLIIKATKSDAFYSHILTINVDGKKNKVVVKDVQRHPYKNQFLHMDFFKVTDNTVLKQKIPVHFENEDIATGVKLGGNIHHLTNEVEVTCKAKDLPEFLSLDLKDLEIGHTLHASDIKLPKGVKLTAAEQNTPVVNITKGE